MARGLEDIRLDLIAAIDRGLVSIPDTCDAAAVPPAIERRALLDIASDIYQGARDMPADGQDKLPPSIEDAPPADDINS